MDLPELSLCVGVTGHRDIHPDALPRVEVLVREAFAKFDAEFGLNIVVLSSLAEGADRLVARIALERGAELVVPLPSPPDQFEQSFGTPEAKAEFRRLLAEAASWFVVDRDSVPPGPGDARISANVAGYRRAGLFVARSCHVLLALWDGREPGKPAGTWEIVRAKLAGESSIGRPDPLRVKADSPKGIVVQVRTPRVDAVEVAPELVWPAAGLPAWKRLEKECALTRRFNDDAAALGTDVDGLARESGSARYMRTLPEAEKGGVKRLIGLYVAADRLARDNQTRVRRVWLALYGFGLTAVLTYGLYAHTERHHWSILGAYLGAILLSFIAYSSRSARNCHERFIDYRCLAEGLRVAFYWSVAGLPGDPVDRYPANLAGEVEWVRMVLRGETARSTPRDLQAARTSSSLDSTMKGWVEAQLDYFRSAGGRHSHAAEWSKRWTSRAILAGIALALVLFLVQVVAEDRLQDTWFDAALVAIAVVPAIGASIAGYATRLGYESQAHQYRRMAELFDHASMVLRSLEDDEDRRLVLARLASEALAEQAQWAVIHRERPFEFVGGGG